MVKPTWLLEGGYEHRGGRYGAWQIRYQSYQTVFAGGFGITYGNMNVYAFPTGESPRQEHGSASKACLWERSLEDPGARGMGHLARLMNMLTPAQFLDRIPDQSLLVGDPGTVEEGEGLRSSRLQATRGRRGDYAMVYSANGRSIQVRMERLAGPHMDAFWFDPRHGTWWAGGRGHGEPQPFRQGIPSGPGAGIGDFDPPGKAADGNDWVLVLRAGS